MGKKRRGVVSFGLAFLIFLPGGGAEYDESPFEKVYFVLSGEITIRDKEGKEIVLRPMDSIFYRTW